MLGGGAGDVYRMFRIGGQAREYAMCVCSSNNPKQDSIMLEGAWSTVIQQQAFRVLSERQFILKLWAPRSTRPFS